MAKKRPSRPKLATPARRRVSSLRGRGARAEAALDIHRCEQFLAHEARLLDEAKFDDIVLIITYALA